MTAPIRPADSCVNAPESGNCFTQLQNYCVQGDNARDDVCFGFITRTAAEPTASPRVKDLAAQITNRYCSYGTNITSNFCRDVAANRANQSQQLDEATTRMCEQLGVNWQNVNDSGKWPREISSLCACNLPQSQYNEQRNKLIEKYPALQGVSLGDIRCLTPGCPGSLFIPAGLRATNGCQGVQCINAIDFQAGGDVKNVDFNQNSACANIAPSGGGGGGGGSQGGGGGGTPPQQPSHTNWAAIIGWTLLGLILVGAIVGLIIGLGKRGRSKSGSGATNSTSTTKTTTTMETETPETTLTTTTPTPTTSPS